MTDKLWVVPARRALVGLCLAVLTTFGWSTPASAHTEFVESVPAADAVVDGPLSTVTIEFTNPAQESGEGFRLLEPDGTVRIPDAIDPTDGTSFVASFDPPLDAGMYGFRWEVQAGDAHPIQGSFQFTVEQPATVTAAADEVAPTPITSMPTTAAPVSSPSTSGEVDHSTMSMDEFLAADETPGSLVGRAARTLTIGATVFAGGVIAALVWVVRGRRDEIDGLLAWVRLAGLGLLTGGIVAWAALEQAHSTEFTEIATTKPGVAALMTMAGGALAVIGFGPASGKVVGTPHPLSAAVAVDEFVAEHDSRRGAPDSSPRVNQFRWRPDARAAVGLVGIALAVGAYWFDGHTVSRGPWIVHAAVNLVHVSAASVWVGGVFAITLLASMRKRRAADTGLAAMVVRFSTIAAVSLAALSVAGLAMAWLILESPAALFSSDWGRVLLVKTGAVAAAAGLGGYNHFVLRPALEARPDDPVVATHLRGSLLAESGIMCAVIVITAVLVASST